MRLRMIDRYLLQCNLPVPHLSPIVLIIVQQLGILHLLHGSKSKTEEKSLHDRFLWPCRNLFITQIDGDGEIILLSLFTARAHSGRPLLRAMLGVEAHAMTRKVVAKRILNAAAAKLRVQTICDLLTLQLKTSSDRDEGRKKKRYHLDSIDDA
jgi:hypothetical protein